jgi:hypothetical protein
MEKMIEDLKKQLREYSNQIDPIVKKITKIYSLEKQKA